jgi:hypothetical protein
MRIMWQCGVLQCGVLHVMLLLLLLLGVCSDAPLKRAIKPMGGINVVKAALQVSAAVLRLSRRGHYVMRITFAFWASCMLCCCCCWEFGVARLPL